MSLFMIVGSQEPLYQLMIKQPSVDENILHYAINGSLDILDEMVWTNQATYLKTVDEFQGFRVSAFVTPTNLKLIIAHERRNEDGIRGFFQEVHDLLIKMMMNPFYTYDSPLVSSAFDTRVKGFVKKYL